MIASVVESDKPQPAGRLSRERVHAFDRFPRLHYDVVSKPDLRQAAERLSAPTLEPAGIVAGIVAENGAIGQER
jgi:hypothetical protein